MTAIFDHQEIIAKNIISYYFKPSQKVRYLSGQFIELSLPNDNPDERGIKRWFTLSSSPNEELLAITTKFPINNPSTFKQSLINLEKGQSVNISDPMGDFVLPKDKSIPLIFVAGGIGVTPMRSIIKNLSETHEQRDIILIYAVNNLDEIAFDNLFSGYKMKYIKIPSEPTTNWPGESGRLDAKRILKFCNDEFKAKGLFFVSGPEQMVENLVNDLKKSGINEKKIVGDYFPNYQSV